ncbi:hypothetical protein [Geitlerinema sp. PCC 7407]|uniref:hypothetical protein n=1 Tax=Geitlerinema sp. PCC 7407 TaxID=1173025 RepID=UPI00029FFB6F|nr:hypothetical protein [Geitlerinema sp. PCC 7407]AFY68144.1 hypothetical protein GEI7407_3677 [Geitlerinema sp. PCC 7407]
MTDILCLGYLIITAIAAIWWIGAFLSDEEAAKDDPISWIVLSLGLIFSPITLPVSLAEVLLKKGLGHYYVIVRNL